MRQYEKAIKEKVIISIVYVILVCAIFSDILRIPYTSFTFFRICLPISVIIIALYPICMKWFISLIVGLGIITTIQYGIFYLVDRTDLQFSFAIFLKFFLLYISIFIIFLLMRLLKDKEQEVFEKNVFRFIIYTGLVLMVLTVIDFLDSKYLGSRFFGALKADNQNNYGCYIAAVFPFLLVDFQTRKEVKAGLGIIASFVILFINDSKAALFGIVISSVVFLCIAFPADTVKKMLIYRYLVVICALVGIVGLIIINPTINGYSLQDTIYQPIRRVLMNDPYPDYGSSISYRTNTTLYCIRKLISLGGLGVGIGNTGVLLKYDFPDLNPEYEMAINSPFISLHNSWLEIALDIGIIVLIIYIIVIKYALKLFFTKGVLSTMEKIRAMYIVSFPVWIMSTSGIYTLYYLFIVMGYLVFGSSDKKKEMEKS